MHSRSNDHHTLTLSQHVWVWTALCWSQGRQSPPLGPCKGRRDEAEVGTHQKEMMRVPGLCWVAQARRAAGCTESSFGLHTREAATSNTRLALRERSCAAVPKITTRSPGAPRCGRGLLEVGLVDGVTGVEAAAEVVMGK
jgi:hypothetical protein